MTAKTQPTTNFSRSRIVFAVWVPLVLVSGYIFYTSFRYEHFPVALQTTKEAPHELYVPAQPDLDCTRKVLAAIENVVPFNESRFVRCAITAQVQILMHDDTKWILQSLDEQGNAKTVGGDEYYITYSDADDMDHPHAVARALDQKDGTYILDFVSTPMMMMDRPTIDHQHLLGYGQLKIHFEYTCGVGRMGQPMKDDWNSAGYTHTDYTVQNVTMPPIRAFQPPISDINLGSYDDVFVLGDSVMNNFVGHGEGWFHKTNLHKGANPASALNTQTVDAWLAQLRSDFGAALKNAAGRTVAVMVGSSTWDILRNSVDQWMTWDDHKEACRRLITGIRAEYHVEVLWKSATAIHICNPNVEEMALNDHFWGVERVRYMSESRSRDIDEIQKALMNELQVPVLDVYEATYLSAGWSRTPTDARHYDSELNERMLNWFYHENNE